jgi:hypothetical protein
MVNKHGFVGDAYFDHDTFGPSTSRPIDMPALEQQVIASYVTADFWQGRLGLSMFPMNFNDTGQPHSFLMSLREEGHT